MDFAVYCHGRRRNMYSARHILWMAALVILVMGTGCEPGEFTGGPTGSYYEEGADISSAGTTEEATDIAGEGTTEEASEISAAREVSCQGLEADACDLLQDPDLDPELAALVEASRDIPIPPTTLDKIYQALAEGRIDELTARKYLLFAYLRPEKVPEELRAAEVPPTDAVLNEQLQWLDSNFDSLPEADKSELDEFVRDPLDERSYFHPKNKRIQETPIPASSLLGLQAPPYDPNTKWIWAEPLIWKDHARVFFMTPKRDEDKEKGYVKTEMELQAEFATTVMKAIKKAWPLFKDLLNVEPDAEVYAFLMDPPTRVKAYGRQLMLEKNKNRSIARCRLDINPLEWDPARITVTAAHELFHCFQDYIPLYHLKPSQWLIEIPWLLEATATWAGHYVCPTCNSEWRYLARYFFYTNVDLFTYHDTHAYGSYLWFLFLHQYYQSPDLIAKVLLSSKGVTGSEGMQLALGPLLNDIFPIFAQYNFNRDAPHYNDDPYFPREIKDKGCNPYGKVPTRCQPSGRLSVDLIVENTPMKYTMKQTLKTGGIQYTHHIIKRNTLKRVIFEYESLEDSPYLFRQAAIYRDGTWTFENWSKEGKRLFCLDRPEDKIDAVVVIHSNARLDRPPIDSAGFSGYPVEYNIDTRGSCKSIGNYTHVTASYPTEGGILNIDFMQNDSLEYSVEKNAYILVHRITDYNRTGPIENCSGSLEDSYKLDEGPIKFELAPTLPEGVKLGGEDVTILGEGPAADFLSSQNTGDSQALELGGRFYVYPEPVKPGDRKWITCTFSDTGTTHESVGGLPVTHVILKKDEVDVKSKKVKGGRTFQDEDGGYTVDFEYNW